MRILLCSRFFCQRISSFKWNARGLCHESLSNETNQQQEDGGGSDGAHGGGGINDQAILSAALDYVPQYGWSQKSIQKALTSYGLPSSHTLSSRGPDILIEFFETNANKQLLQYIVELQAGETPIKGPPLICEGIQYRLQLLIPYIKTWPEAMAIKAYPSNLPDSLERLALMLDEIWYQAGDRSVDFNWYTKRALLAGVYCSTELYMIQDGSVDFKDTWTFLQRRFEDTKNINIARNQLTDAFNGAMELSSIGFTTVRNMLGMNSWKR